ncbi:MAG: 3-hydroxyacyl-ACP dehydratase FabZ [Chromatiales bacterium]|jgi:3-hydroxyacyl-[acyl-carrier-protein] dehydratase
MHMDIQKILQLLPHRYPFLLIDRVTECTPGESLSGYKNVSFNEPFFQGHFPIKPVMPGVLIIEALAQATALLAMQTAPDDVGGKESLYYFVGIDKARFKGIVSPGDQLELNVSLVKRRMNIWTFSCEAKVDGKLVASAEIMCTSREV